MKLAEALKDLSHHAYAIIGDGEVRLELRDILAKQHKVKITGNPDFFDQTYDTFTIDDARNLKAAHEMRPVSEEGKKIFVLTMNGIGAEAQNALLKLLEEPAEYAHFFLIIPSAHLLLPTVKSRVSLLKSDDSSNRAGHDSSNRVGHEKLAASVDSATPDPTSFLKASIPKRLEIVKSLLDDISKEKKTSQDAIHFIDSLEKAIHESAHSTKSKSANLADVDIQLTSIDKARNYLDDRAPSLKMLLEYVALNI